MDFLFQIPANVLFQSGICLFPSGVVKPSTSITAFVLNAPLQNVGFLILQRWVFNFGTLGFLFVFFIRQSALQPFTRNKKSETISNTHWLTLFLRCCNYKHTLVDLIRLFCAVPPRKRRNRPLMASQTPSELSQTPSEFTIPKVPHPDPTYSKPPVAWLRRRGSRRRKPPHPHGTQRVSSRSDVACH